MSNKRGLFALSPLFVFIAVYLCGSLLAGDFYKIPLTVAFMAASIYAIAISGGMSLNKRIDFYSKGASSSNLMLMLWIFVMAGAFAHSAKAMGSIDATVALTLSLLPGNMILAAVAFLVSYLLLNYTKIGTYTYAIGSNEFVAKNMGINIKKYKVIAFIIAGSFLGVEGILTISYGSSMVATTGMGSMSRNFFPTMGCFFGLALKKYGIPIPAIIIGEFFINIIYYGFVALGAPTAIQDVIVGLALLIIVTLTTKVDKGEIVK